MQFSNEWDWDETDFIIMGLLIFSSGVLIELVRTKVNNTTQRVFLLLAVFLACLYIWAELAVGIFTNWGS